VLSACTFILIGCTKQQLPSKEMPAPVVTILGSYKMLDEREDTISRTQSVYYYLGLKTTKLDLERVRISQTLDLPPSKMGKAYRWKYESVQLWLTYDNLSPKTITGTKVSDDPNDNVRLMVSFDIAK
jgi:hypothetical protein